MMIRLPWPDKALSPNARSRTYHKHARVKKAYRTACGWAATAAGLRKISAERVRVRVTFNPPNANRRDDDNTIASFKAGRDGVADVIGIDDGKWDVEYVFGQPVKGGAVVVEVVECKS